MTRNGLKYWREHLKVGDIVGYQLSYAPYRKALVLEIHEHTIFIDSEYSSNIQWKYIRDVFTIAKNPEEFL